MHPLFQEICRASELQAHVLRRLQRALRDEIQPMLDEREALIEETASLREQIAALMRAPETRGPGRPRKDAAASVPV